MFMMKKIQDAPQLTKLEILDLETFRLKYRQQL